MEKKTAFEQFAPAILRVYRRDEEAFWAAVMAPFLADDFSLPAWFQHLKVDFELLAAFRGLDDEARRILKEFSAPLGLDVTQWKSNRSQYFKDAYPVFAFLAIWMAEEGLDEFLERFDEIIRSAVFGVAGYGILDENVDGETPSPVEVLTAQALIAEYETVILSVFGVSKINLEILHRMRSLFLEAEIKEKAQRGKGSPYRLDRPEECGTKGAHVVTPYMLSLERLGKAAQIEQYWRIFLLFGAVIQIIDDWSDLEKDLAAGHFSYLTLGAKRIPDRRDPARAARELRADGEHVRLTYRVCQEMIAESRAILAQLGDRYLGRLVDVTEVRLEGYFRKKLAMK